MVYPWHCLPIQHIRLVDHRGALIPWPPFPQWVLLLAFPPHGFLTNIDCQGFECPDRRWMGTSPSVPHWSPISQCLLWVRRREERQCCQPCWPFPLCPSCGGGELMSSHFFPPDFWWMLDPCCSCLWFLLFLTGLSGCSPCLGLLVGTATSP